jgi:two-component system, chemotaxis family, chemotaxis protein CheY
MKVLIVEDDFTSRKLLLSILAGYGTCDVATDGIEAVEAFKTAWDEGIPYNLICMDIMMPRMDGHEALTHIKSIEKQKNIAPAHEVRVIMTTALGDPRNVFQALYKEGAVTYLVKPISKQRLLDEVRNLGML